MMKTIDSDIHMLAHWWEHGIRALEYPTHRHVVVFGHQLAGAYCLGHGVDITDQRGMLDLAKTDTITGLLLQMVHKVLAEPDCYPRLVGLGMVDLPAVAEIFRATLERRIGEET